MTKLPEFPDWPRWPGVDRTHTDRIILRNSIHKLRQQLIKDGVLERTEERPTMNKLPAGAQQPPVPMTVVYIGPGEDTTQENLKHLFVTLRSEEQAVKMLHLMVPGSHMIGLLRGHVVQKKEYDTTSDK